MKFAFPSLPPELRGIIRSAALCLALFPCLIQHAAADTTITGTQNVTGNPLTTFWNAADTVTIQNGATLFQNQSSSQSPAPTGYIIPNALVFSGSAGTTTLRFSANDTKWHFSGPITSTATGNQIINIRCETGDRQDILFSTPIPDGASGTTGISANYSMSSSSENYINLSAANTFTGPITLNQPNNSAIGILVVGGERYWIAFGSKFTIPGTGSLGPAGVYPGNVSLANRTVLNFNTSANQTMSGIISGAGSIRKEVAGSTLTLSGNNTYTGDTTVDAGSVVLANGGSMSFAVTDTTNNKVTGAGSATLN
ncbi:MAG: hypothetical protein RLZZ522_2003, partial [Verrucomicrobiota bacterium]